MTKAKAKPHTKKKPTRKSKATKPKRVVKAGNPCCPVIKWKCDDVKVPLPKEKWDGKWTGGSEGSGDYVTHKTYAHVTRCKVSAGSRTFKNLDPIMKDDKVAELKKALEAKRCMAVIGGYEKA